MLARPNRSSASSTVLADHDDAMLVARCRDGEQAAWTALVNRYQRLVYAIVRRMGLDEHAAADVFQTVFSRLVEHLPRIVEPHRLQAWVVTTAKREALLQRARSQRNVSMTRTVDDAGESVEWDVADDALPPEEELGRLQQVNRVRNALEQLDDRCRALMVMLFDNEDEKLSYDEVARRIGSPVGSIGPTRARCLAKLRTLLE
jgi:RNA polymerase sigma factor (sigma-70 family)